MGPMIFDSNKQLILLIVIPLGDTYCTVDAA